MQSKKSSKFISSYKPSYFEKSKRQLIQMTAQIKGKEDLTNKIQPLPVITVNNSQNISAFTSPSAVTSRDFKQKQSIKSEQKIQKSQSVDKSVKDSQQSSRQGLSNLQNLVQEIEELKLQKENLEEQIALQKKLIKQVKQQMQTQSAQPKSKNFNYSIFIFTIDSRMKNRKNAHQQQLNLLLQQKNAIQNQNQQLFDQLQKFQSQCEKLQQKEKNSQKIEPMAGLAKKIATAQQDIVNLHTKNQIVQNDLNSSKELKLVGYKQFQRYADLFFKKSLGAEIAMATQAINMKYKLKKNVIELQKIKSMIKDKKIQNTIRYKRLVQLNLVIEQTKDRLYDMSSSQR